MSALLVISEQTAYRMKDGFNFKKIDVSNVDEN